MRRLLLVTHRPIDQPGGPAARWRAFARYLPEYGWEVDVLSAAQHASASEFDAGASPAVARRAAAMGWLGRVGQPAFRLAGVRPDAVPLSMLWIARGARLVRRRIERRAPDVVLASGPPIAGPIAARAGVGARAPLVVELRDLWAGNPAFDAGGRALSRIEDWLLDGARRVIACTPEAVADLRRRHPEIGERILEISNGFDPQIESLAAGRAPGPRADGPSADNPHADGPHADHPHADGPPADSAPADGSRPTVTLLHSGTLTAARPLAPLLRALADPRVSGCFRLVLHGHLSPASRAEVQRAGRQGAVAVDVLAPSPWQEAVRRIAQADAGVIVQGRDAGDETAIASKLYEYLALGKPVLCITDGGASEALLRRLGADELCARLGEPERIVAALSRLRERTVRAPSPELLQPYSRRVLAGGMAALLDAVADGRPAASTSTIRSAA